MMNNTSIINMLTLMSNMTKQAMEGTNFVEVSTYVRNHIDGIDPSFVEVFRDMICPIVMENHSPYRYVLVTYEYGCRSVHNFGDMRKACIEEANHYNGDNGFAYIYTTDPTLADIDSYRGGIERFDSVEDLEWALDHPQCDDDEDDETYE